MSQQEAAVKKRQIQSYTPEFRAEAVKLVLVQGLSVQEAADRLNMSKGTLGFWATQTRKGVNTGVAAAGTQSVEELTAEIKKLRKELAETRMERDVIKNRRVLCSGVTARYAWISEHRGTFPVAVTRRVLGVSRAGFYSWLNRGPSARDQGNERLKVAIRAAHGKTRESYGARRLQPELASMGFVAGRDRIARLRRQMGLQCRQKRKFKATTNSAHSLPVAENVLGQVFEPSRPDQVWCGDITYISTDEGWLYLAGLKDVYSCAIAGYAMSSRMTTDLVSKAFFGRSSTADHLRD
jgi:putative transposase